MAPLIKVTDQNSLVPTKSFPYGKFPFEFFNPIQSRMIEYYNKENNAVIAASTSGGKSAVAELFMSYTVRMEKKKAMYLAPMRALCSEKHTDWIESSHHFSDLKISICTGDYKLTADRKKELENTDIIIMSSEMLNHRARNKSERSEFLEKIGVLVVDEGHLLGDTERGSHLEHGLMRFTEINNKSRLVMLSATMPNNDEIAEWVSYILTRRQTILLTSSYRPCPLNLHFEKYQEEHNYDDNEMQKVNYALQIVKFYPDDKFLIFCHTKKTGEVMKKVLLQEGINTEFHNAGLDKANRIKLEKDFKEDPKLRVIIGTSTLAVGINMPARRTVILGVHRGMTEVAVSDLHQMAGRSGRIGYDKMGDCYFLLPEKTFEMHKARLRSPQKIESQLKSEKTLAFHLVNEIYQENTTNLDQIHKWYTRSLAYFQSQELEVDKTIKMLKGCGAIREEDNTYSATSVGKIASLFYYSPFDVSDLKKNFTFLFDEGDINNDHQVSFALGNTDTSRVNIVSRSEKEEMSRYAFIIKKIFPDAWDQAIKAGFAYFLLLQDKSSPAFASTTRGLQFDFPRLCQVLQAIDTMSARWNKVDWLQNLQLRIAYGVSNQLAPLCMVEHIGKKRAEILYKAGFKSASDIVDKKDKLGVILGLSAKMTKEILESANSIVVKDKLLG